MKITLPFSAPGERVVGGILFTEGVADVTVLGTHARTFFERKGATFDAVDARAEAGLVELTSLSRRELDDIAAVEGLEHPAKASKAELIDLISSQSRGTAIDASSEPFGERTEGSPNLEE